MYWGVVHTKAQMKLATPYLKPGEMPFLTRTSTDRIKDMRRVGVFDDGEGGSLVGTQQENGRWLYSMSDAFVLATMQSLRNTGLDRITLLNFALQMKPGIMNALGFDVAGAGSFAVFWLDDWQEQDSKYACLLTDNPRDVHTVESTATLLFDLLLIAQNGFPNAFYSALSDFREGYNQGAAEFDGGANGLCCIN